MNRAPWNEALLVAVRKLEIDVHDCQAENAELKTIVARQRKALYDAADRLENWKLRQEAWRAERDELLGKINGFSS